MKLFILMFAIAANAHAYKGPDVELRLRTSDAAPPIDRDLGDATVFLGSDVDVQLSFTIRAISKAEGDGFTYATLPTNDWIRDVRWQIKRVDGTAAAEVYEVVAAPTAPGANPGVNRSSEGIWKIRFHQPGVFTISVSLPYQDSLGQKRDAERFMTLAVFRGDENVQIRSEHLRFRAKRALSRNRDLGEFQRLLLERANLTPDDPTVWKELAETGMSFNQPDVTMSYYRKYEEAADRYLRKRYGNDIPQDPVTRHARRSAEAFAALLPEYRKSFKTRGLALERGPGVEKLRWFPRHTAKSTQ